LTFIDCLLASADYESFYKVMTREGWLIDWVIDSWIDDDDVDNDRDDDDDDDDDDDSY
jgi:hypothetical protein